MCDVFLCNISLQNPVTENNNNVLVPSIPWCRRSDRAQLGGSAAPSDVHWDHICGLHSAGSLTGAEMPRRASFPRHSLYGLSFSGCLVYGMAAEQQEQKQKLQDLLNPRPGTGTSDVCGMLLVRGTHKTSSESRK